MSIASVRTWISMARLCFADWRGRDILVASGDADGEDDDRNATLAGTANPVRKLCCASAWEGGIDALHDDDDEEEDAGWVFRVIVSCCG